MHGLFKEMKRQADRQLAGRRYKRDAEDRIVVDMTVQDDSEFLSVFSEGETPVISMEVADFIESRTRSLPPQEPLTLRIHSDCIDDREKQLYAAAVREYYTERYAANRQELRRNRVIAAFLLLAGVLVLSAALWLGDRVDNAVWAEVIDIVAWVLLWEAADISLLENRTLRWKEKRYLSCTAIRMEYVPLLQGGPEAAEDRL
ncbi:MAG: hypothetical protein ACI3VB_08545 [Oscillospiraceae bacterium]